MGVRVGQEVWLQGQVAGVGVKIQKHQGKQCWNAELGTHLRRPLGVGACLSSYRGQNKGWSQPHCWAARVDWTRTT